MKNEKGGSIISISRSENTKRKGNVLHICFLSEDTIRETAGTKFDKNVVIPLF